MIEDNRKRALAEVVSIDAWHRGFSQKVDRVDLHVDVVFKDGRIGGEQDSDVRFRLRLKRAEIVVIVPATEPARIDKRSVSRDAPRIKGTATQTRKISRRLSAGARASAAASTGGSKASIDLAVDARAAASSDTVVKLVQAIQSLNVTQIQTADNDYAWVVEPTMEKTLAGRPWDAQAAPRLKVIDERLDRTRGIEPHVRVEVRCRREDLEISDISLKDRAGWMAHAADPLRRNRVAAAEALIRTRLFEAGLITGDISDPFAQMTLCAAIAEGS